MLPDFRESPFPSPLGKHFSYAKYKESTIGNGEGRVCIRSDKPGQKGTVPARQAPSRDPSSDPTQKSRTIADLTSCWFTRSCVGSSRTSASGGIENRGNWRARFSTPLSLSECPNETPIKHGSLRAPLGGSARRVAAHGIEPLVRPYSSFDAMICLI